MEWLISRLLLVGIVRTISQIEGNEIRNLCYNKLHVRICFGLRVTIKRDLKRSNGAAIFKMAAIWVLREISMGSPSGIISYGLIYMHPNWHLLITICSIFMENGFYRSCYYKTAREQRRRVL